MYHLFFTLFCLLYIQRIVLTIVSPLNLRARTRTPIHNCLEGAFNNRFHDHYRVLNITYLSLLFLVDTAKTFPSDFRMKFSADSVQSFFFDFRGKYVLCSFFEFRFFFFCG